MSEKKFIECCEDQMEEEDFQKEWENLVNEGNSLFSEKRYAQSELRFIAALRIMEKLVVPDTIGRFSGEEKFDRKISLSKSLNNLAALYCVQGKYSMADDLLSRCLALKQELFGRTHLESAAVLHNQAVLNSARGCYDTAEALYKEAREIK